MRNAYLRTEKCSRYSINQPKDVYLPLLRIKLGGIKNFVKALDKNSTGFMYLKNMFSMMSDDKIKVEIFVGPQINKLIQDIKFEDQLSEVEEEAWKSFKTVSITFLREIIWQKTIVI
jgi:hypothetical protein